MREIGVPGKFIDWIMVGVTTVSYKYTVANKNFEGSQRFKAR